MDSPICFPVLSTFSLLPLRPGTQHTNKQQKCVRKHNIITTCTQQCSIVVRGGLTTTCGISRKWRAALSISSKRADKLSTKSHSILLATVPPCLLKSALEVPFLGVHHLRILGKVSKGSFLILNAVKEVMSDEVYQLLSRF